ncbi:epigen [Nelusetta ayraudi]|uniref:epigen n=1 Tax=Nelusetta ayraudi TaxID=303726 RepID=UPI003F72FEAE
MFTLGQTLLRRGLLSALALLLLTTAGRSAVLTDHLQTTAAPALSALTTELFNTTMEEPKVQRSYRPCGDEHTDYCKNDGQCIIPQDADKPACICTASYSGDRCLFVSDQTRTTGDVHEVIAITMGILMLALALAVIILCCVHKKCKKSAPLIKSAPSESSV